MDKPNNGETQPTSFSPVGGNPDAALAAAGGEAAGAFSRTTA